MMYGQSSECVSNIRMWPYCILSFLMWCDRELLLMHATVRCSHNLKMV